ncbi:hypothetical protein DL89DRAFT_270542 [Linderina pennispora]|uniref:Uncharacterized protein n=1 Tax=Linderina pennispora TaxID=61395 RepID=A0A1Y1VXR8_9FUNG|nr:uncharacterized protein DL89DRAFT_270542 [Linderina pennispora]ORX65806.1 hypothetical protein DL89DRAFT_270542 [Linderina pennispora]
MTGEPGYFHLSGIDSIKGTENDAAGADQTLKLGDLAGGIILQRIFKYLVYDDVIDSTSFLPSTFVFQDITAYHFHIRCINEYALICRQWMESLKPYACRIIYITSELLFDPLNDDYDASFDKVQSNRSQRFWWSNIKSVIRMGGTQFTKRLTIHNPSRGSPLSLDVLLEGCGFGATTWPDLRDIVMSGEYEFLSKVPFPEHIDSVHAYLSRLAPSLGNIHCDQVTSIYPSYPELETTVEETIYALDNKFTDKRLYLDSSNAFYLSATYFPHLTSLVLFDMYTFCNGWLMKFLAPTLKELAIHPSSKPSYKWAQFADSDADTIEFKELITLKLSGDILHDTFFPTSPYLLTSLGHQKLLLPKLRTLEADQGSNAHFSLLDQFTNIPLRTLAITEHCKYLPSINPLLLSNVEHLSFTLWNRGNTTHTVNPRTTVGQLFEAYSEARSADIRAPQLAATCLNWPYLQNLRFDLSEVDWNLVEGLISKLPHLRRLSVSTNPCWVETEDIPGLRREIGSYEPTSTNVISRSLEAFEYNHYYGHSDPDVFEFIQQLVLRTPSLLTISVWDCYQRAVSKLIAGRDIEIRIL